MTLRSLLSVALLVLSVPFAIPVAAQPPQDRSNGPQTRPAPGNQPNRPPSNGGKPQPGGGNNGGSRPQPGGGKPGGNRPQPGGGRPGAGNQGGNRPKPQPPRPQPSRPQPSRPGNRPPQWGRPPQNRPSYNFRPNDRDYLRRHYLSRLRYINRARRPSFAIGGFFPYGDVPYLSPLPPALYGYLPPPPTGYSMGYFDGYVVVYDPITYFIANVVDLLQ
jgi:hypothetical protein